MEIKSFYTGISFDDNKVNTRVILETSHSREIRILMKQGQKMKEHKAPYPIIVHVLKGKIEFGINGKSHLMGEGSIIDLESNVPHDLNALEDSIIRLSLSKSDDVKRVENVINS